MAATTRPKRLRFQEVLVTRALARHKRREPAGDRSRSRGSALTRATATVGVVACLSSCAVNGLSFVADDRLTIHTPAENESVGLPFTMAWSVDEFEGQVVLFFDRSPMRPGQDLSSLVPEGDPCRADPACPTADWLADRNIYVTDQDSLIIDSLPDRRDSNSERDRHDVTVVLLNDDGQRSGESAFTKEFIVERDD